jgi:tetratricopeptide (TPR) repeat protein
MTVKRMIILLVGVLFLSAAKPAEAGLSQEQKNSLFNQANESFRQANSTTETDEAEKLYEKAILAFEKIIDEGKVKNAKLYYNLANSYFLKGRLGKAILNYRRAEELDSSDENIKKNLAFARSKRIDKIGVKTERRVLHTLFFWHYDFSLRTKFLLTFIFFGFICIFITTAIWFGRSGLWSVSAIILGILTVCLLSSVIVEAKIQADKACGVITDKEVTARQGDGQNYPASFKEPLHEGTEFDMLEHRPGWFHIKLSDDSDGWIPEDSAELI